MFFFLFEPICSLFCLLTGHGYLSSHLVSGSRQPNKDPIISNAEGLLRGHVGVRFLVGREGQPRSILGVGDKLIAPLEV